MNYAIFLMPLNAIEKSIYEVIFRISTKHLKINKFAKISFKIPYLLQKLRQNFIKISPNSPIFLNNFKGGGMNYAIFLALLEKNKCGGHELSKIWYRIFIKKDLNPRKSL